MLTHKGTETIYTKRLILRRFRTEDAGPMFRNWANDSDVCRYITWSEHGNIEVTRTVVDQFVNSYDFEKVYIWAMEYRELSEPIGSISTVLMSEVSEWCEVGYCMGKSWWNMGLMSEALAAVMDYLFREVGFHRIQARHDVDNPASGRVMQKCGMQFEGILREAKLQREGRFSDLALYGAVSPYRP
jgi:ribosomal-protein-alanine N-acetyltransferase